MTQVHLSRPLLILILLTMAGAVVIGYASATTPGPFGPYTTTWEGTSEFQQIADDADRDVQLITDPAAYDDIEASGSLAVILSPNDPYAEADRDRIARFVNDGGTLFVAEAYGPYGNELLESVGATTRLDGSPLRDDTQYNYSPAFPRTAVTSDHPLVEDVEWLVLNHGSAISQTNGTILASSSALSYLDPNRTHQPEDAAAVGPHPVASVETVGNGSVIVVSDPSLLINEMLAHGDNRQFLEHVLAGHDRVIMDTSHGAELPPAIIATMALRDSLVLQLGVGILGLFIIRLGSSSAVQRRFRDIVSGEGSDDERTHLRPTEIRAHVVQSHPEWDRARVDRVVEATSGGRRTSTTEDERDTSRL